MRTISSLSDIDFVDMIAEIELLIKSDEDLKKMTYFVTLKNWTETGMELYFNFTEPLALS